MGFPVSRQIISRVACIFGLLVTTIKDNTSGFFCIRRRCLEGISLTPRGFKIGLEIFVKAKVSSFKEIPYTFINRSKGKSKLRSSLVIDYLFQIYNLKRYQWLRH